MSGEPVLEGASARRPGRDVRQSLLVSFQRVRSASFALAAPLSLENCQIQSISDVVSPTKWYLAHTTWLFDALVLEPRPISRSFDPASKALPESCDNSLGKRRPRFRRGILSLPRGDDMGRYRAWVDELVGDLNEFGPAESFSERALLVEIGLNHEQRHQELMLIDVKHVFFSHPLRPACHAAPPRRPGQRSQREWAELSPEIVGLGQTGPGFAYDNEGPRHEVGLRLFPIDSRFVANSEYLQFVEDGGCTRPELWLSDGWTGVAEPGRACPPYWGLLEEGWSEFTLTGRRALEGGQPVAHLSLHEADAHARWCEVRLPSDHEWEIAARQRPVRGKFVEDGMLHQMPAAGGFAGQPPQQLFGDLRERTTSTYAPYTGHEPVYGTLGETNGRFMCNQFVLPGGSCIAARDHARPTYRSFFHPQRWWHSFGIRLAEDA